MTTSFSYTSAGQLSSSTRSNDAYAWTAHYDLTRPYAANGLNQYTQSGSLTPGYDGRGNLTSIGSDSYSYLVENALHTANGATLFHDPARKHPKNIGVQGINPLPAGGPSSFPTE